MSSIGGIPRWAAVFVPDVRMISSGCHRAWELFSIINPVKHACSAESIAIYKVEPYVVASDVYALSPITVTQTQAVDEITMLTIDGIERYDLIIPLVDDRRKHEVDLQIHIRTPTANTKNP